MRKQKATSIRLTPEAERLLVELAKKLGLPKSNVIELAIRKLAEQENVN